MLDEPTSLSLGGLLADVSRRAVDAMTDAERFRNDDDHLRTEATAFLLEWFGDRCPEYVTGCIVCERWAALDTLLDDSFIENRGGSGPPAGGTRQKGETP